MSLQAMNHSHDIAAHQNQLTPGVMAMHFYSAMMMRMRQHYGPDVEGYNHN